MLFQYFIGVKIGAEIVVNTFLYFILRSAFEWHVRGT